MSVKHNNSDVHARIYDDSEHRLWKQKLDVDALKVISRLKRHGYRAYVVGGAVRDLLLGIQPKDYDLATDATPPQIRRLFSNCRIIGRRFRLIHMYFKYNKIIEVATFRSNIDVNAYGRIEQDAVRRDFTLNALYYDPESRHLIDYVGGYDDIRDKKLIPIIPLDTIFNEDPVRTIRAVKYSVITQATISRSLSRAIKRDCHLLESVSNSRLTEEFSKIILSGRIQLITQSLHKYGMLQYLQPRLAMLLREKQQDPHRITTILQKVDEYAATHESDYNGVLTRYLSLFSLDLHGTDRRERLAMAKKSITPVVPPNAVVAEAVETLYDESHQASRPRRQRRRRAPARR